VCRGERVAVEQPERTAGGSAGCWPRLPASPRATRSAPMAWALCARAHVARLIAASRSGLGVRRSTAFAHLRVAHPRSIGVERLQRLLMVLSSRRPIAPFRWKKRPHKSKCSYACLPIRWHGSPCGPAVREVWCTSSAWRASRPRPDSPLPLVSSISASRNRAHCGTRQAKKAGGAFVRLSLRWCRELAGGRIPHLLLPLRRFEFLSFPAAPRNAPKEKKRSKRKGPL